MAASGPSSGPTTMAPTTVMGEFSTTPMAASSVAITRNARSVPENAESSPARASTCCQLTESGEFPGASRSARSVPAERDSATWLTETEPALLMPRSSSSPISSSTASRTTSQSIRSPTGSSAAPRTMLSDATPA